MTETAIQMLADSCTEVVMKHIFPLRYDICDNLEEDAEMNVMWEHLNEQFYGIIYRIRNYDEV